MRLGINLELYVINCSNHSHRHRDTQSHTHTHTHTRAHLHTKTSEHLKSFEVRKIHLAGNKLTMTEYRKHVSMIAK
jgi:hypothetical protein